eukprot:TRINITY_DN64733_c0_g1_i1.p1 TRINITY_DN64733_c0_g1~~TRINITY_DN64733_c0_g1_i1.p1  ORF type:complete len:803 (+),score=125.05 TRINITY_DN64733_c0_g1_i1:42-2450(+)
MGSGASAETKKQIDRVKRKKDRKEQKRKLKEEIISSSQQNAQYAEKMRFLFQVPILRRLPVDMQPLVASCCSQQAFLKGFDIIVQGEVGDEFFVIQSGEASVKVHTPEGTKVVATLHAGDYFGEKALLASDPRSATITAETYVECLSINRKDFNALGLGKKLTFADRKSVSKKNKKVFHDPTPKTDADRKFLRDAITGNENICSMGVLEESKLTGLIDKMWREPVTQGMRLIKEGDLGAEHFYIIESGKFDVIVQEEHHDADKPWVVFPGTRKCVDVLGAGDSFGELALLFLVPRRATILCSEAAVVWKLDRTQFKSVMIPYDERKQKEYMRYFENVPLFMPLLASEKEDLAAVLVEVQYRKGEVILRQGDNGNTFFMLVQGDAMIIKDSKQVGNISANPAKGEVPCFGERALIKQEKRAASVVTTSETARCLMLDKDSFDDLLGPLKQMLTNTMIQNQNKAQAADSRPHHPGDPQRDKIFQKDLVTIGRMGCGGYSFVDLVHNSKTGKHYALKCLSKGFILKGGMQQAVQNEKDILYMTSSPFIVKLYETYNRGDSLYFLLECCLGGDLFTIYKKKNLYGQDEVVRFHVAGAAAGLSHLHTRRIIYRDMKPENIVLDEEGYVKLTDFGSSKFAMGKTYTVAGTPDYFAPEIIKNSGHHVAVDWWSLGVTLFELMSSRPPFESAYPMQIYAKIEKGIERIPVPALLRGNCEDVIKQLCSHVPTERLCMRDGGTNNLFKMAWYRGFDVKGAENRTAIAPYKPVVRSNKDLANFTSHEEDQPRVLDYEDPRDGWDGYFASVADT